jgi:hypothetical protein
MLYRAMLETKYGVEIKSCKLLRVHSSIPEYELIEVPDLRVEVKLLFEELEENTTTPNVRRTVKDRIRARFQTLLIVIRLARHCKQPHSDPVAAETRVRKYDEIDTL